ncbi:MAG: SGNH/GDSL hydrolase family protein [Candidatus Omnitrophica bacterium]|nr:SGNH/GDSL hydrolase family protein [Candidatus Omnitrophota bacterium]
MNFWKKFLFSFLAVLIFFGVLEIVQRIRYPYVGFRHMNNSLGFHDLEFSPEKAEGIKRIIFIGSSTTYGGERISRTFPSLTGKFLREKRPDLRVETINAALPSKTSYWEIERMKETLRFQPDIFVVMTGYNDSALADVDLLQIRENGELVLKPWPIRLHGWIARHSVFYVTLREKISLIRYGTTRYAFGPPVAKQKGKKFKNPEWFEHYPEKFRRNLETMIALARENNVSILFIKAPLSRQRRHENPLYEQAYERLMKELLTVAGEHNVPVIDLEPLFSGPRWPKYLYPDGLHFNDVGNAKIARTVSRYFYKSFAPSPRV